MHLTCRAWSSGVCRRRLKQGTKRTPCPPIWSSSCRTCNHNILTDLDSSTDGALCVVIS